MTRKLVLASILLASAFALHAQRTEKNATVLSREIYMGNALIAVSGSGTSGPGKMPEQDDIQYVLDLKLDDGTNTFVAVSSEFWLRQNKGNTVIITRNSEFGPVYVETPEQARLNKWLKP